MKPTRKGGVSSDPLSHRREEHPGARPGLWTLQSSAKGLSGHVTETRCAPPPASASSRPSLKGTSDSGRSLGETLAREKGFVFVEFIMEVVCVTGLIVMVALFGVQSSTAVSSLSEERGERMLADVKGDLERVAEEQFLHYLDSSEFARSPEDLAFVSTVGVAVEVQASPSGWSATGSHAELG
ncbi:MAG: hypothetical protein ACPGPI_01695 [Longimicrobiales bacterium]